MGSEMCIRDRVVTVPSGPPPGAGRREGAVVEARVASMVAQSEAVMATGVALVMGAGTAAMAAVKGGRLGGGGGLDRARGRKSVHDTAERYRFELIQPR